MELVAIKTTPTRTVSVYRLTNGLAHIVRAGRNPLAWDAHVTPEAFITMNTTKRGAPYVEI